MKRLAVAAALVAFGTYAAFLVRNISDAAGGADSSGYLNEARLLARGTPRVRVGLVDQLHVDPALTVVFTPLGFNASPNGTMTPVYPPGLPLMQAMGFPFFVAPVTALLCLCLTYAVARELTVPPLLAIGGVAMLAAFPPFILHAIQPVSDVPATFWCLLAMWCALRSRRTSWLAVASGFAFAASVAVRPMDAMLIVAIVLALRGSRPLLVRFAIGAAPIAVAMAIFNAVLYGNPFLTGYGIYTMVGPVEAAKIWWQFAWWTAVMITPVIFPIGLGVVFDRRVEWVDRAMLIAWFAPFMLFYSLFFFDGWWCVRYMLPGIPAAIIGAMLLIRSFRAAIAVPLLLVMLAVPVKMTRRLHVTDVGEGQSVFPQSVRWAEQQMGRNAIVIAGEMSGAFYFYSDRFTVRWEWLDADRFQLLRAYAGNAGLKWYAMALDDNEVRRMDFEQRLAGRWTRIGKYRDVSLWRLE